MLPPDECLDAYDLPGPQRDLRLEVQDEPILLKGRLQCGHRDLERQARGRCRGRVAGHEQLCQHGETYGLRQGADDVQSIRGRQAARRREHALVETAYEDDARAAVAFREVPQQLDAVPPRHPEVEDDHVEVVAIQAIEIVRVRSAGGVVACASAELGDQLGELRFIVDDEQT